MIKITSLLGLEAAYNLNKNANVISIRDSYPSENNKRIYDLIDKHVINSNLYVLNMDDISDLNNVEDLLDSLPLLKIPSKEILSPLINWCENKIKENNNFIIHCTAGVSRSSSIAVLIQSLLTPNSLSKIKSVLNYELHEPNGLVLELIEEMLKINGLKKYIKNV